MHGSRVNVKVERLRATARKKITRQWKSTLRRTLCGGPGSAVVERLDATPGDSP